MGSRARRNEQGSCFFFCLKFLLVIFCLCGLAMACSYVHPVVVPILMELEARVRTWCTVPVLFVLVNAVVAALYLMNIKGKGSLPAEEKAAKQTEDDEKAQLKAGAKPSLRLWRSKSEQIWGKGKVAGSPETGSRLRKAGTLETSSGNSDRVSVVRTRTPRHRLVVVADPPLHEKQQEDEVSHEVDRKAEDFIGRFYQNCKLQRLQSLLRRQQQQQHHHHHQQQH